MSFIHIITFLSIVIVFPSPVFTSGITRYQIAQAPAVWGDPPPDYSDLTIGPDAVRFIYTILFVDSRITANYNYDMPTVKREVLKVVEEANKYFMQLHISVVVLDILQTMEREFSLMLFQEYHKNRKVKLPPHDFAVLMTYKYAGGLAFVGGMCTESSVMLCGFYPQEPRAMGSIFFHEVAHLVGVPHKAKNSTLSVPNCRCDPMRKSTGDDDVGCLRIPGFDHDCTAQQFVNVIYKNRCLRKAPMTIKNLESICGNGVREAEEDCDCGLEKQCSDWNCVPEQCIYRIHPLWMWLLVSILLFLSISIFVFVIRRRGFFPNHQLKMHNMFECFKNPRCSKSNGFVNATSGHVFVNSLTSPGTKNNGFPQATVDPNSIVVLLDRPPRSAATLHRPRMPPPPPPPKTTISVEPNSNAYEIPNSMQQSIRQSMRDDISWKFDDFDSDDETPPEMSYSSYRGKSGVPTCPSYPPFSPINRVTVEFHGSGETMETECRSSKSSSSSAINGTSI